MEWTAEAVFRHEHENVRKMTSGPLSGVSLSHLTNAARGCPESDAFEATGTFTWKTSFLRRIHSSTHCADYQIQSGDSSTVFLAKKWSDSCRTAPDSALLPPLVCDADSRERRTQKAPRRKTESLGPLFPLRLSSHSRARRYSFTVFKLQKPECLHGAIIATQHWTNMHMQTRCPRLRWLFLAVS